MTPRQGFNAAMDWMRGRFRNRPDSEHEQALFRLAISAGMATILLVVAPEKTDTAHGVPWLAVAIAIELIAAVILVGAIAIWPGVSHTRRVLGMLADYFSSGLAMWVVGVDAAPLWGIFLWASIGNGLRFGTRYLLLAIVMSSTGFAIILMTNPSWSDHPILSWTMLGVLIVIPAYLYRLVKALTDARDEAARANEAKSWFLASMSHELRTPLNGLLTAIELLRTTRLSDEQRTLSETATASGTALLHLVNDILDISAIEAGRVVLRPEPVRVREIVENVRLMLAPTTTTKGIELRTDVAQDVPETVELDANRTTQALMNLTHNAVKFTAQGHVDVNLSVYNDDAGRWLRFEVIDTGVGIEAAALERIFKAFEQADQGTARRFGGTGLGTTIAKAFVERMGGAINAASEPGKGSRFWFRLPLKIATSLPATPDPRASTRVDLEARIEAHRLQVQTRRVLVLDDLAANREVLRHLLHRLGHEPVEFESAGDALDAIVDSHFDVALIDWHMPVITGLDFLTELRSLEGGSRHTPIIVLTADATPQTRARAMSAGVDTFITKPISVHSLIGAIEDALGKAPSMPLPMIEKPREESPLPGEHTVIDRAVWEELQDAGLSLERVISLARSAMDDAARNLSLAGTAAARQEWEAVKDHCHALKGVAANAGARRLATIAGAGMRLEPDQRETRWPALETELRNALREALDAIHAKAEN